MQSSHTIQGVQIHLKCDQRLHSCIANFFEFFYKGESRRLIKPLLYELSIVKEPPAIPPRAVRAIKTPDVSCYKNSNHIYYVSDDGSVVCLDPARRKAKGYLREEVLGRSAKLFALVGAPFADMLKYNALYSLHSAALYSNGVGYLFSGKSGSGKTTTTLSLVCNGFKYVSDDSLLLEDVDGEIIAHSLTKTFNVDRDLAGRFPGVVKEEILSAGMGTKALVHIDQHIPDSFIPHLRPYVIVFLKIIPEKNSNIYPLNQMEVFRRLLKQTVLAADKEVSQNQIKTLGRLARQVRGFELLSGRDVYEDPACLVDFMAETGCHYADI